MKKAHYAYKTEPYQHQIDAFYKFYDKKFAALFFEMGLGKTKATIDIVSNLHIEKNLDAVLVIAPNTVHSQWCNEEIPTHSPTKNDCFLWRSKKTKTYLQELEDFVNRKTGALKWFCVNVETFSNENRLQIFKNFCKSHRTAIILDEATTIKNPSSNRFGNITYKLGNTVMDGRKMVLSEPYAKYKYILTGTMITNSPYDLWSMFEFLDHGFFGMNYYAFRNKYGLERQASVTGSYKKYTRHFLPFELKKIKNMLDEKQDISYIASNMQTTESNIRYIKKNPNVKIPYKNLEHLKESIQEHAHIVRKKDCKDLPEKIFTVVRTEMTNEQRRVYKELEKESESLYQDKTLSAMNKLSIVMRLSQITGGFFPYSYNEENEDGECVTKQGTVAFEGKNPKIEVLKREIGETDEKIIIFARFTAEIDLIITELRKTFPKKRIEGYYGATPTEERERHKKDFKEGNIDIMVGNPMCAGVGLNLQRAHITFFYSNSYSLYYREQAVDRTHRITQTETCVYKDIIMKNTIDEKVYKALQDKKNLLEYFREKTVKDFILEY